MPAAHRECPCTDARAVRVSPRSLPWQPSTAPCSLEGMTNGIATPGLVAIFLLCWAGFLLAPERRPAVLFVGNQKLDSEVKSLLEGVTSSLRFGANVRPSLDTEDLGPAAHELAVIQGDVRQPPSWRVRRRTRSLDANAWPNKSI